MNSVFVAMHGIYSSRTIIGVFESREKAAEMFGDSIGEDPEKQVQLEEWPMNTCDEGKIWTKLFCVNMNIETGDVQDESCESPGLYDRSYEYVSFTKWWISAASIASAEHAVKLAAEARQQILRESALLHGEK